MRKYLVCDTHACCSAAVHAKMEEYHTRAQGHGWAVVEAEDLDALAKIFGFKGHLYSQPDNVFNFPGWLHDGASDNSFGCIDLGTL